MPPLGLQYVTFYKANDNMLETSDLWIYQKSKSACMLEGEITRAVMCPSELLWKWYKTKTPCKSAIYRVSL